MRNLEHDIISECYNPFPTERMKTRILILFCMATLLFSCKKTTTTSKFFYFPTEDCGLNGSGMRVAVTTDNEIYVSQYDPSSCGGDFQYFDGGSWQSGHLSGTLISAAGAPMTPDASGAMWFLMYQTLVKVNHGQVVDVRSINISNLSVPFREIMYHNGYLWLLHPNRGLFRYNINTYVFTEMDDPIGSSGYGNLVIDSNYTKWTFVNGEIPIIGLSNSEQWNAVGNVNDIYNCSDCSNSQLQNMVARNGLVYVNKYDVLGQIVNGTYSNLPVVIPKPFSGTNSMGMELDQDGNLWLYVTNGGTLAKVYQLQGTTFKEMFEIEQQKEGQLLWVLDMYFDNDGNAWFTTTQGVFLYFKDAF